MIKIKNVEILRRYILQNGYTFAELARKIGISRSCLDKIFKRETISPIIAKKICLTLEMPFDYFFYIDSV